VLSLKNNWPKVALVAGVLVVVWFTVEIILAGNGSAPPPPGSQPLTLHGGQVRGNRVSTRSWSFDYKSAQMSPDGTIATVDGVHHGVLYKNGKPYLGIAAEHVSVNTQTFDFTALGDVHISYLQPKDQIPRSFDTDLVQWTNATKLLMLTHPSIFRTGDQTLKVASITVDFNKSEIHLGKVEGSVQAPNP
jgi:hypothetical protein